MHNRIRISRIPVFFVVLVPILVQNLRGDRKYRSGPEQNHLLKAKLLELSNALAVWPRQYVPWW
jgi:hypothetical protein